MIVQIRSVNTWETIATYQCNTWTYADGTEGSLKINVGNSFTAKAAYGYQGQWVVFNGSIFYITGAELSDGILTIKYDAAYKVLYTMFAAADPYGNHTTWGSSIAYAFEPYWCSSTSKFDYIPESYQMSYMYGHVNYSGCTIAYNQDFATGDFNADSDLDIYDFMSEEHTGDYLDEAIASGVKIDFVLSGSTPEVVISDKGSSKKNIIFDGAKYIVDSESYSKSMITDIMCNEYGTKSKSGSTISASQCNAVMSLGTDGLYHFNATLSSTPYYFDDMTSADDTYTPVERGNMVIAPRAKWSEVNTYAKFKEYINGLELGADNEETYSIEFRSKEKIAAGTTCVFNLHGIVYEAEVTTVTKSNGDEYYTIECGYLTNTVQKKLRYRVNGNTLYL